MICAAKMCKKIHCQRHNVIRSIPKRRNRKADHVKPIEQIFPETAFGHALFEVGICGGDNSHIRLAHLGFSQTPRIPYPE